MEEMVFREDFQKTFNLEIFNSKPKNKKLPYTWLNCTSRLHETSIETNFERTIIFDGISSFATVIDIADLVWK